MKQIFEALDTFYKVESVAFGASLNVLAPGILPHELSLRVRIDLYNPSYCWLKGIGARPSCFSIRSHLLRCSSKKRTHA